MNSGQNPIEPAKLGCKIFHGPNVRNFTEIYEYLKTLGVTREVDDSDELSQLLSEEFNEDKVKNDKISTNKKCVNELFTNYLLWLLRKNTFFEGKKQGFFF